MKRFTVIITAAIMLISVSAFAGESKKGLFVNLTSNEIERATMAINFAQNMLKMGHPATILLSVEGAILAKTSIPQQKHVVTGKSAQDLLAAFISAGGTVIITPPSMQKASVKNWNMLPGVKIGNPNLVSREVFGNTQIISW